MPTPRYHARLRHETLGLPARVADARGRRVRVFGLGFLAPNRSDAAIDPKAFQALRHKVAYEAGTATTGESFGRVYAALIALFLASVILARVSWSGPGVLLGFGVAVVGIAHLVGGLTATRRMPAVRPEAVVAVLLRERRCAACAHALDAVEAEDDGCTVCPECGSAWRLDPAAA